jgi:hypothetical protein
LRQSLRRREGQTREKGSVMSARARDLIGRKIVAVDLGRQWDKERKVWFHQPRLTLDNGRRVWFMTEETETGDYGTKICISDAKARKS